MWDVRRWSTFWGLKETDIVPGQAGFVGDVTPERLLKDPNTLVPAEFRLAKGSPGQGVLPGGKDLGADVDLVGPGEAYERWKKTPQYQEWRKKTEELMNAR